MKKKGLTQVELLISISILAILFSLGTIVYNSFVKQGEINTEALKVKGAVSEARAKTVAGFSLGGETALNFGLHFEADSYTIFPGSVYQPDDVRNQKFILLEALEFTEIVLPSSCLVFSKINGEISGFDPAQNYVILSGKGTSQQKKISANRLGTVMIEDI